LFQCRHTDELAEAEIVEIATCVAAEIAAALSSRRRVLAQCRSNRRGVILEAGLLALECIARDTVRDPLLARRRRRSHQRFHADLRHRLRRLAHLGGAALAMLDDAAEHVFGLPAPVVALEIFVE